MFSVFCFVFFGRLFVAVFTITISPLLVSTFDMSTQSTTLHRSIVCDRAGKGGNRSVTGGSYNRLPLQ